MKTVAHLSMALLAFSVGACVKPQGKSSSQSAAMAGPELRTSLSGLGLTGEDEQAYVLDTVLECDDESRNLSFTKEQQSKVIFQSVRDCELKLESFLVEKDGEEKIYSLTNRTANGFKVYETEPGHGINDVRLAKGSSTVEEICTVGECEFSVMHASFEYSELLLEEIELENNLQVSEIDVGIELEPAPDCDLSAAFVQPPSGEPELVFSFSDCRDLFASELLELRILSMVDGTDYDIEWLHEKISEAITEQDAGDDFEIRLSVDDLKALADSEDIFTALTQDFVVAIRNKGGMSGKIYLVDNLCEIVAVHPPQDECETAYALGDKTFIELGITSSRWGWQITANKNQTIETPIYAGAAQNDLSKGEIVGKLIYSFAGGELQVEYDLEEGFGLQETQLYAGVTQMTNAAPGQYGNQHLNLGLADSDSYEIDLGSAHKVYLAAHAVVCPKIDHPDDNEGHPDQR